MSNRFARFLLSRAAATRAFARRLSCYTSPMRALHWPVFRWTLYVAAAAVGCTDKPQQTPSLSEVRDSSQGPVVVRFTGSARTWRAEHIATIGVDETGELEFGTVRSVLLDGQGRLFVVDPSLVRVSEFDSLGAFVRHIGRKGTGPGEYIAPYSLASFYDSLALFDPYSSRISLLNREGRWVRQWTVAMNTGGQAVRLYRASPNEFWAYATRIGGSGVERVFVRYSRSGPTDTVSAHAVLAPRATGVTCMVPRGISFYSDPLSGRTLAVPLPSGEVAIATSTAYRILILAPSGDTLRIFERPIEAALVSDDDWSAEETRWHEWRDRMINAKCDRDALRRPATHPVVEWLVLDDSGNLWVAVRTVAGRSFDVFDPTGSLVATVTGLPPVGEVDPSIAGNRIALVVDDSLGRETVRLYRVIKD